MRDILLILETFLDFSQHNLKFWKVSVSQREPWKQIIISVPPNSLVLKNKLTRSLIHKNQRKYKNIRIDLSGSQFYQ